MALADSCISATIGPSHLRDFLKTFPHSSAPGHNLHREIVSELSDGDPVYNASDFFASLPYTVSYPVPVSPPFEVSRSVLNGLDPCLDLVNKKKEWVFKRTCLQNSCRKSMIKGLNLENASKVKIHPNVAALATHLQNDPDQYFNACYNWYFSGSNIEIIDISERKYLIRPNCVGGINFSPLIFHRNQWILDTAECNELNINLNSSSPLYQVDAVNNFALVRGKSEIYYLTLKENDFDEVEKLYEIKTTKSKPFLFANINKKNKEEFCTLLPNEDLTIWNISNKSPVTKIALNFDVSDKIDSRSFAYYLRDSNIILFADRYVVRILDLRDNGKSYIEWPIHKVVDICEEITCCHEGGIGLNYVGTSHHLLALDIRQGWTQRWTHGMTTPPSILKIINRHSQDLIFMGNQRSDVIFIQNELECSMNCRSKYHPYSLPSLRESLHLARYNGLCLDHLLTARFTMSMTGLCCLEDRYVNVIRCTSINDIFWQKLETASGFEENLNQLSNDDMIKLRDFESSCEDSYLRNENKCWVTSVKDTTNLVEYLYASSCPEKEDNNVNFDRNILPRCKNLKEYRDQLAPILLEAWELDDDEWILNETSGSENSLEDHLSEDNPSSEDECDVEYAVSNWLNTYSRELRTNVEYSVDDDFTIDKNNYSDKELPKYEFTLPNEINENSQMLRNSNSLLNASKLEDPITLAKFNIEDKTKEETKEQKPLPKIKRQFVSGF